MIFTVIYAISAQVPHLKDNSKFQVVIALVISLLVIIPHVTNYYAGGIDVVEVINRSVPQVALLIIAVVMVLMLIGATGKTGDTIWTSWIRWVALAIVGLIFLDNINYGSVSGVPFLNWLSDPDFQALILIILVFGLIIKFVTGSEEKESKKRAIRREMLKWEKENQDSTATEFREAREAAKEKLGL